MWPCGLARVPHRPNHISGLDLLPALADQLVAVPIPCLVPASVRQGEQLAVTPLPVRVLYDAILRGKNRGPLIGGHVDTFVIPAPTRTELRADPILLRFKRAAEVLHSQHAAERHQEHQVSRLLQCLQSSQRTKAARQHQAIQTDRTRAHLPDCRIAEFFSVILLRARIDPSGTLYRRAMPWRVSPEATVCILLLGGLDDVGLVQGDGVSCAFNAATADMLSSMPACFAVDDVSATAHVFGGA
mmetsp:Transcript_1873/g.3212  ORF Transcript_1873/g.3212 Transcript_1873/m.3212 type:complete len:243 (-) Transcript_1873:557-1285(-)